MTPFLTTVIEFVKEWQTLIGALLAIGVVVKTIKVLNLQTLNETNRHLDHQRRKGLVVAAHNLAGTKATFLIETWASNSKKT